MLYRWTRIGFNFEKEKMNELISSSNIKTEIIIEDDGKFYGKDEPYKNVYKFDSKNDEIYELFLKVLETSKENNMECCLCYSWYEDGEGVEHYNQKGEIIGQYEIAIGSIFDIINDKYIKWDEEILGKKMENNFN